MTAENGHGFNGSGATSSFENKDEDIRAREDRWLEDFDGLTQSEPDPLAPIADQQAHTDAMIRLRQQAEELQSERKAG